jgi:hypothetical protein
MNGLDKENNFAQLCFTWIYIPGCFVEFDISKHGVGGYFELNMVDLISRLT